LAISATSCGPKGRVSRCARAATRSPCRFADARHGGVAFDAGGIRLALLARAVEGRVRLLALLLEREDGKAELAGEELVAREKPRTPRNALAFWDLQVFAFAGSLSATGENLAKSQPG
jgi:hypothetical protein